MTEYIVIAMASFITSFITFYSGFGLGTLLMPVYALFFPMEVAIASTAIVHGANNILKMVLVGKNADKSTVIRFGFPAILAAFAGAGCLVFLADLHSGFHYTIGSHEAMITPIKATIAVLMFFFALFELLPNLSQLRFDRKYLMLGGFLSGFFGGLSGHQGALRAAFLTKTDLDAKAFVGTNAMIGFLVDAVRIGIYAFSMFFLGAIHWQNQMNFALIGTGVISAFLGVFWGQRYLHKITMSSIQMITGVLLIAIAILLGLGIL